MTGIWFDAGMLLLAGSGLAALALGSDKPGAALLGHKATARERLALRLAGWPLLALALLCGISGWGHGVGWVTWFGWLTVAGAGLVFAIPYWDGARATPVANRPRKGAPPVPLIAPPQSRLLRGAGMTLLAGAPLAFVVTVAVWPVQPVWRADAIAGRVGPWTFTIAEDTPRAPQISPGEDTVKAFQIRFCDGCHSAIRAAYLTVGKPQALHDADAMTGADRRNRLIGIQLPDATRPDSEIWLTVEGKNGSLHQTSWPLARIAPATARWFAQRGQAR